MLENGKALLEESKNIKVVSKHRKPNSAFKLSSEPALVVDDDDFNVLMLQELLKQQNYESETAISEQKAIDLFKNRIKKVEKGEAEMYQFILLDYSMPGIGGLGVAKIIC